jgi:hypothetical protein
MNPDPLSTNDKSMTYRDAAIVATILMLSTAAFVFMPTHGYDVMMSNPSRFAYDLFNFLWTTWITTFVSLTGLTYLSKKQQPSESSESG